MVGNHCPFNYDGHYFNSRHNGPHSFNVNVIAKTQIMSNGHNKDIFNKLVVMMKTISKIFCQVVITKTISGNVTLLDVKLS